METVLFIIGQIFGVIAILLGFLNYQVRTKKQILMILTATSLVFVIHYGLIGAYVGMALNLVNIVRNFVYDYCSRKAITTKAVPIAFAVIQGVIGILTWGEWYSIFVLIGQVVNAVCVSFADPQKLRKSILFTSSMVFLYDLFSKAAGGAVYEIICIVSAIIGLIRYRKNGKAEKKEVEQA